MHGHLQQTMTMLTDGLVRDIQESAAITDRDRVLQQELPAIIMELTLQHLQELLFHPSIVEPYKAMGMMERWETMSKSAMEMVWYRYICI